MNNVTISGNLTRDPETRVTAAGTMLANFTVAVNGREKVGGEWRDRAEYVDCSAFGYQAERLAEQAAKGTKVAVYGRLRYSTWETKDGQKRGKLEVSADEVEVIAKRPEPRKEPQREEPAAWYEEPGDIPF